MVMCVRCGLKGGVGVVEGVDGAISPGWISLSGWCWVLQAQLGWVGRRRKTNVTEGCMGFYIRGPRWSSFQGGWCLGFIRRVNRCLAVGGGVLPRWEEEG